MALLSLVTEKEIPVKTTFILSAIFSLGTFATPTGAAQNRVPPEVKDLVTELRENLNPGEHLQHSRKEAVGLIRHAPQLVVLPFFLEEHPISHLTDDEIFDYLVLESEFFLVCSTYLGNRYFIDKHPKRTIIPDVCENHFLSTGEKLNAFTDVINYYKADYSSIQAMAKNLVQSRYWESTIYKVNSDTLLSDFEETTETLKKIEIPPSALKEWNDLLAKVPSLQNADVYFFRLLSSWGYIAFENGQARLIMLMYALNWNRMMNHSTLY